MKQILVLFTSLIVFSAGAQQKRCSTTEYMNALFQNNPALKAQNEQRIKDIIEGDNNYDNKKRATPLKVTVVFHIIHNGTAIGQGANIADSVVYSQLDALNEDYNLKNADSLPASHPFKAFNKTTDIEFCLATKTPSGANTSGITRDFFATPVNKWDFGTGGSNDFDATVKPSTIWDHTRYLNIWVCDLEQNTLGYAIPPGFSGVSTFDGVVIGYKYLGYIGSAVTAPYDYGRTAVHEVGHYLGLDHIWGNDDDGNGTCDPGECSGTDNIGDTPNQCERNFGCPNFPKLDSCTSTGSGVMFMNYMDYVDDKCMKMFTNGQVTRMRSVLNGSRSGVANNNLCVWPTSIADNGLENKVIIYPNPASDRLTIETSVNNLEVSITDITGKIVSNNVFLEKVQNGYIANISSLVSGVYFVKVFDGKTSRAFKFIKN